MTPHVRKYREKESHPFPVWNGIFEHRDGIACAIWVFLWCIDKVTEEREGIGIVLGGSPVKIASIAADLKMGEHTIRRHCDALEERNYIRRRRTPYGFVIEVLRSRKFGIWSPRGSVKSGQSFARDSVQKRPASASNLAELTGKNGRNKEDAAVDAAVAALPRSPLWEEIGVNPKSLAPEFMELCEGLYRTKGNQSPYDFLGICMDAWQSRGNRIPRAFAMAKAALRDAPRREAVATFPVADVEDWGRRG